jgi:hypothetical protein
MHPQSEGLLESSLYVDDVVRSALFYEKIFGFRVISLMILHPVVALASVAVLNPKQDAESHILN